MDKKVKKVGDVLRAVVRTKVFALGMAIVLWDLWADFFDQVFIETPEYYETEDFETEEPIKAKEKKVNFVLNFCYCIT